jgi:chromosome segregation ATPase
VSTFNTSGLLVFWSFPFIHVCSVSLSLSPSLSLSLSSLDTSYLIPDRYGAVTMRKHDSISSLQKQLTNAKLKHNRTESDLGKFVANLEQVYIAQRDSAQKLEKYTVRNTVRKTKSLQHEVHSLEAEIARLDRESEALEHDARAEEVLSAKLAAVRAGVKKDTQKYQRNLVARAQKFSNLSIQADSAKATLNLIVGSTRKKTEQLISLHRDVENLEAVLGAIKR